MLSFILGLFIGGLLGILFMSLLIVAKRSDEIRW